jgi:hypothetical protein
MPSRKLVKAQKSTEKELVQLKDNNINHARPTSEPKATDSFESDIAWVEAWDTRKKIRIFYCSRVLRKLRHRCQNTSSS